MRQTKIPEEDLSLILKAIRFAAHKHRGQNRKDENKTPYVYHPIAVAETLRTIGRVYEINTIVAGLLHDTIEDTNTSRQELEAEFGKEISSIILEVTDDKSLPKEVRKRLQVEHAGTLSLPARQVKIADKICNLQDIINTPPAHWSQERQLAYIVWAEEVVNAIRGTNAELERHFDDLCNEAMRKIDQSQ